jgi:hypothetical protein
MDTDLSMSLVQARASTQQSVALAVLKQTHQAEMATAQMVEKVARAAPPEGQGRIVDKLA